MIRLSYARSTTELADLKTVQRMYSLVYRAQAHDTYISIHYQVNSQNIESFRCIYQIKK